jgi:hypothetical protein
MQRVRLAPLVAIAGCLLVVVVLAVPYLFFQTAPGTTVDLYYGSGAVNPLVAGGLAFVATLVLAAGREERTDPLLAAGVGLALGVFVFLIALAWVLTVPDDVYVGISASDIGKQHRWFLALAALVPPVASAWWARTLGVL